MIVRTLSKSHSLAGLRVGMIFAHPEVAAEMAKVKDSYNLDRPAQAAAAAALADAGALPGATATGSARPASASRPGSPGSASRCPPRRRTSCSRSVGPGHRRPPASCTRALRERGFLVRFFDRPGLDDGMRISIGTDAEMDALVRAIAELVGG